MLHSILVDKCCGELLEKSVVAKCWREVLEERLWGGVGGGGCCGEELEGGVVGQCV